jgi:hypothetical protein
MVAASREMVGICCGCFWNFRRIRFNWRGLFSTRILKFVATLSKSATSLAKTTLQQTGYYARIPRQTQHPISLPSMYNRSYHHCSVRSTEVVPSTTVVNARILHSAIALTSNNTQPRTWRTLTHRAQVRFASFGSLQSSSTPGAWT